MADMPPLFCGCENPKLHMFETCPTPPQVLDPVDIKPVKAYVDPVLATHIDGSAVGCEIIPSRWQLVGTVLLMDDHGNMAFDRNHDRHDVIPLGPFRHGPQHEELLESLVVRQIARQAGERFGQQRDERIASILMPKGDDDA